MDKNPNELIAIKVVEVAPTHIAQRCPNCNGWGTVSHGSKVCESCEGKGYILVPAKPINSYTIPRREIHT